MNNSLVLSRNSLCRLRVLRVSVVVVSQKLPPSRHKEHAGGTEKPKLEHHLHFVILVDTDASSDKNGRVL